MNTNPQAKVVLCFGDSNTRGTRPDSDERYAANVRWTGQLQSTLGDDFYVVEEGLGGRTTDLDDPRPEKPGRNGLAYFKPSLLSHAPADILVIMLGTNDLKNTFNRSAQEIAAALKKHCDFAKEQALAKQIILVSPAPIIPVEPIEFYDQSSADKSLQLAAEIQLVAESCGAAFLDSASLVTLGQDGLHWTEESNKRFADALATSVRKLV